VVGEGAGYACCQEDYAELVYKVTEGADYSAGSPGHDKPFYFL
jgi:hypothetical protein